MAKAFFNTLTVTIPATFIPAAPILTASILEDACRPASSIPAST